MKLGTYVEVALSTRDSAISLAFYESLGFKKLGDDVMTDGSINIRLMEDSFDSPTLSYWGTDMAAIFSRLSRKPEPMHTGEFHSPNNTRVTITREKSKIKMPGGTPSQRIPISRLGKFGEFSIPVQDRTKAMAFWMALGFEALHGAEIPYPYAILSDGLIVVGLHQTPDFDETVLTYFATDMAQRIQQFEKMQVDIRGLKSGELPDGSYQNAFMSSPDGQGFFLFHGEI